MIQLTNQLETKTNYTHFAFFTIIYTIHHIIFIIINMLQNNLHAEQSKTLAMLTTQQCCHLNNEWKISYPYLHKLTGMLHGSILTITTKDLHHTLALLYVMKKPLKSNLCQEYYLHYLTYIPFIQQYTPTLIALYATQMIANYIDYYVQTHKYFILLL